MGQYSRDSSILALQKVGALFKDIGLEPDTVKPKPKPYMHTLYPRTLNTKEPRYITTTPKCLVQLEKMFAGGVAGAAAILVTYPLETLRTRVSIAGGASSLSTCIRQIWQTQGPRGFYQGLRTGLCCEVGSFSFPGLGNNDTLHEQRCSNVPPRPV